jgi:hypothetical protein
MKILRLAFASVIIAAAGALAACNGGTTYTAPTPGPTCNPAAAGVTAYQLVYPAPGATAVPVTASQIVIAVNAPLPNYTWNLFLTWPNNAAYTANPLAVIAASQLPPGSATTTIPNPTYESVQLVAQLPAGTTIGTALNNATTNCTPATITGGSFTTEQ